MTYIRKGGASRNVPLSRQGRAAFTLIETAVVVSITSLLFALAATTLIGLMRLERQFITAASQDRAVSRLASQFRADAHAALEAEVDDGCTLRMPAEMTARYSFAAPAVVRELRRGDKTVHSDSFVLSRQDQASFAETNALGRQMLAIRIQTREAGSTRFSSMVPLEIVALVNLHAARPNEGPREPAAEAAATSNETNRAEGRP
jgi:type II secretory pathway pseudopilin PulG